jgi:hypothetical protein
MSVLKTNKVQIGQSGTATQNFVLEVPTVPDGTMTIKRGIPGATTQDILSVAANGAVTVNSSLNISSALPAASGGTGITSAGAAGNVLTSNGTTWVSKSGNGKAYFFSSF